MHSKRHVVVRGVVAMSHCRLVQIEGLAYKPSDIATTRRTTTRRLACFARDRTTVRQRAVWRFCVLSLATGRQDEVRQCAVWRFVVLSLVPTRCKKAYQISHHKNGLRNQQCYCLKNTY
jgi:hypothetical protein